MTAKTPTARLWADHENRLVAEAERRLYLAGAAALRGMFLEICHRAGVSRVTMQRALREKP